MALVEFVTYSHLKKGCRKTKICMRQSWKVISMDVLSTLFLTVCIPSCRTYFCWFPLAAHKHTSMASPAIRDFKIWRLRTTTTVKHATAHDQTHVTVHFSRLVARLRWIVELLRVGATSENILLAFCRLASSRIWFFRKKSFQFTCFKWEGCEICRLCLISAQIYAFNTLEPLN